MTGPSSPRGERAGKPGATWETELRSLGEVVVPDDDGSPFGWAEGFASETATPGMNLPQPPRANRAARRAAAKAARRNPRGGPQGLSGCAEAPEPRRDAAGRSGDDGAGFNGDGRAPRAGRSGDSTPSEAENALHGGSPGLAASDGPGPASSPRAPATAASHPIDREAPSCPN